MAKLRRGKRAISRFTPAIPDQLGPKAAHLQENKPSEPVPSEFSEDGNVVAREKKGYDPEHPVRVYYDGVFDLFHFGHARALEQAKKLRPFTYLIAGVCNDELTHALKGKTVLTDRERYECVRHCKWVDEVIEGAPWIITSDFLEKHQIDYVAQDATPYPAAGGISDVYASIKAQGRFLPTQRTQGISTSDLITRIVRDYDLYLRRNLERGVSPSDLNISFLKQRELILKKYLVRIGAMIKGSRRSIEKNWAGTQSELMGTLDSWEQRSQELIHKFTKSYSGAMVRLSAFYFIL
ncbi:hypothetical protein DI09_75p20 [Mitosporidium daphniae]|uniref:choline-phosphate cytidylyltransferase n=1 Tax=Mitosporidium daphniae TaxID=1485682 RepID=A0A098VMQ1_9MICR|nr:uncharacterized protein DI09_75p20 [Mitosporidium daphniae]KGG50342.1 hypothetical protein DI09_75p20 [Mitosporidium daphniae]|eukprot:XP_013236787.1 uncharacterized protein DI09_75p20 [Mitosporidium daphniae]